MNNIVELLEEKNRHLDKFYRLNEEELTNFRNGNFENLETFYHARECLLDLIKIIDRKIGEISSGLLVTAELTEGEKKIVMREMAYKDEVVQEILAQDLQVLSCIEETKSKIIKELRTVRSAKKVMSSYQSGLRIQKYSEEA